MYLRTVSNPDELYRLNNGFMAYQKANGQDMPPIWLWDSTGRNREISAAGGYLQGLGSKGEIMLKRTLGLTGRIRRFYIDSSGHELEVSSVVGAPIYRNDGFYLLIGNKIYKYEMHVAPDTVRPVHITLKDSVYTFTATDFTKAFSGPGALMSIQLNQLPKHGKLLLPADVPPVTEGRTITRSSLVAGKLTYVPDKGFTGTDTVYWNAFNGYTYTPGNALLTLTVPDTTKKAVISFFTGALLGKANSLQWGISEHGELVDHFGVERSTDGKNFTFIGQVNANSFNLYQFSDATPPYGLVYYRLKLRYKDGRVGYSTIAKVYRLGDVTLSPNPVPFYNPTLHVHITHIMPGKYSYQVTNILGAPVKTGVWQATGNVSDYNIVLDNRVTPAGVYNLVIKGDIGQQSFSFLKW
jgi:hypothetical protein